MREKAHDFKCIKQVADILLLAVCNKVFWMRVKTLGFVELRYPAGMLLSAADSKKGTGFLQDQIFGTEYGTRYTTAVWLSTIDDTGSQVHLSSMQLVTNRRKNIHS